LAKMKLHTALIIEIATSSKLTTSRSYSRKTECGCRFNLLDSGT
jgi:hypothetical protein